MRTSGAGRAHVTRGGRRWFRRAILDLVPPEPQDDADEDQGPLEPEAHARALLQYLYANVWRRRVVLPPPPPLPDPERSGPDGCVAIGGELGPELVVDAYRKGIFPMAESDGTLGWWSPDPRTILELDAVHVPRRLQRTLKQGRFEVRFDTAFDDVIAGCADRAETWISDDFKRVYGELHRRGTVHTVETWSAGKLVGGLYGVALGAAFMAESMFHRQSDASKVAVVALVERLRARGFTLCDIQYQTNATKVFHPRRVSRREYLARLARAIAQPVTFG
jgi:leucyl/phenylalanyl-tRNA---protein transferase